MEEEKEEKSNAFHNSIGLELGHAPANLALHRILSEKLQFLRFSQVPAGSDCLFFRPILLKTYIFFSNPKLSFVCIPILLGFRILFYIFTIR